MIRLNHIRPKVYKGFAGEREIMIVQENGKRRYVDFICLPNGSWIRIREGDYFYRDGEVQRREQEAVGKVMADYFDA